MKFGISGFVNGNGVGQVPHVDQRLSYRNQSEAVEAHDMDRMGCMLRVKGGGAHLIGEGQLCLPGSDFRDLIDPVSGSGCECEQDAEELGLCPTCNHPDVMPGEICIGLHVPIDIYRQRFSKLSGVRAGRAFSDNGTQLSSDYCSVIVPKSVLRELVVRAALPEGMFD